MTSTASGGAGPAKRRGGGTAGVPDKADGSPLAAAAHPQRNPLTDGRAVPATHPFAEEVSGERRAVHAIPPFAVTPWLTFRESATEAAFRADTAPAAARAALAADRAAYGFMGALIFLAGASALRRRGLVAGVGAATAAVLGWAVTWPASYSAARPAVAVAYRLALPMLAIPALGGGRSRPVAWSGGGGGGSSATAALAAAAADAPLGAARWLVWASTRPVATSTLVLGVLARLRAPALAATLAAQVLLFAAGAPLYCPGVMESDVGSGPFYERAAAAFAAGARGVTSFLLGRPAAGAGATRPPPPTHCPAHACPLVASMLHVLAAVLAFCLAYSVEASERAAWVAGKREEAGGSGSAADAAAWRRRRLPRAVPGVVVASVAAAVACLAWLALEEVDALFPCEAEPAWAGAVRAAAAAKHASG